MEDLISKSVMITGGAGFVGSNLTRQLLTAGVAQIHVVDNLLSSERSNLPDDARILFTEASIADDVLLTSLEDRYDLIFHLSAYHGNQNSIHNPLADHGNSLLTSLKLFERCKTFRRLRKLVYAGAGCAVAEKTFDDAGATPEDAPISLQMDSPYSISKIVGEFYAVYYYNRHRLPTVRARFQNVYGPGEVLGAGRWRGDPATIWRNVTPTFIYKALKGEALPVENGGIASRDFIYVDDICAGLIACALSGKPGDVYNLASGVETTILDLARKINQLTGNLTPIALKPKRDWDNSGRRRGATIKAEREIGFKAQTSLEEGLSLTIAWTRKNLPLIEAAMHKHDSFMRP